MKKRVVVIDANALISFVTDRNKTQQDKIVNLFENAAQLKLLVLCPQNVLSEFVYVLEKVYSVSKPLIRQMISDFIAMPGIEIVHEIDFKILLSYWPDKIQDYGDAIVASVGKSRKGAMVVTFDRKFARALKKVGIALFAL